MLLQACDQPYNGALPWLKKPQKLLRWLAEVCSIRPSPRFSGLAAGNKNDKSKKNRKFESLIKYLNKLTKKMNA